MSRLIRLTIIFGLSIIAPVLFAAAARQKTATLYINHYSGTADLVDARGQNITTGPLKAKLEYAIDSDEELRIVLRQRNPLLFTYDWKAGEPTATANANAITEFSAAVTKIAGLLKPFGVSDAMNQSADFTGAEERELTKTEQVLRANGITPTFVNQFSENAGKLAEIAASISSEIERSARSWKEAESVRDSIAQKDLGTLIKNLRAQLAVVDKASLAVMRSFQEQVDLRPREVAKIASLGPLMLSLEAFALDAPPATKEELKAIEEEKKNQQTKNQQKTKKPDALDPAKPVVEEGQGDKDKDKAQIVVTPSVLYDAFVAIQLNVERVRDMIDAAEAFAAEAAKIGVEENLATVMYRSDVDAPFTLSIEPVKSSASVVDGTTLPRGKFEVVVSPDSPVDFQYDAAAVYSFVETPRFEARTDDNGVTTIVRTDSGDAVNGITGAAMLSIVPRGWNDPIFGRGFQIGFSPVPDELGFFAGGTLRFYDRFSIGAGIAYQQTERLKKGQSVGQVLASPDDFDTDTAFKAGAYITLTMKIQ